MKEQPTTLHSNNPASLKFFSGKIDSRFQLGKPDRFSESQFFGVAYRMVRGSTSIIIAGLLGNTWYNDIYHGPVFLAAGVAPAFRNLGWWCVPASLCAVSKEHFTSCPYKLPHVLKTKKQHIFTYYWFSNSYSYFPLDFLHTITFLLQGLHACSFMYEY